VSLNYVGNFLDLLDLISPFGSKTAPTLIPMEFTQAPYGFILYKLRYDILPRKLQFLLSTPGLRDRAYVVYSGQFKSILSRGFPPSLQTIVRLNPGTAGNLHLLVENQGRVAYGPGMNFDLKGILGAVTINGQLVEEWTTTPLDISGVAHFIRNWKSRRVGGGGGATTLRGGGGNDGRDDGEARGGGFWDENSGRRVESDEKPLFNPERNKTKFQSGMPSFFHGQFVNSPDLQADTFFLPTNLSKGQLFINGVNMGRYWPKKGPQQTLYIPRDVIKSGVNDVIVFELEPEVENPVAEFVDKPKLDKWG